MKKMVEQALLLQVAHEQVGVELNGQEQSGRWKAYGKYKDSGVEWLREIPEHWSRVKLKYLTRLNYGDPLPSGQREEGNNLVYGSNGPVGKHSHVNTSTPVIIIGRKGSFGKIAYSEEPCFAIDTTYYIDNTHKDVSIRWLFYVLKLLKLDEFTEDSAIPGLSRDYVYSHQIPLLPFPEQNLIATFLDRETTRINTLIAKKEQHIALLQEQRTAIINQAVTKGLNTDVPMKDSGVKWLGEIPEGWEIAHLRRVVKSFVDYRGMTPEKVPYGIPLVTARNIKNGVIDFSLSQEYIREEDYPHRMIRGLPTNGDVLITTEAPLGETAQVIDEKIALAQRIILLKLFPNCMVNNYLKYYFLSKAGQGELWSRATGSTAIGIKASHLKEILVIIPSIEEQKAIAVYLDQETPKIDKLITGIQESIKKLKEYSTALISAAVTGKIDVRGEVATASAEDVPI